MCGSSYAHAALVVLFVFGACGDNGLETEMRDTQADSAHPTAAATDAGCAFCVPYDAGSMDQADAGRDAGGTDADSCRLVDSPSCSRVACTWTEAQQKLPECATPPLTPYYAARCGDFDALVSQGTDSVGYHIYDATGRLVAIRNLGLGSNCVVFDATFTVPESCKMLTPKCPPEEDAGA